MIFCSLVIVGVLSKRRGRALRTPTTPRPASASASTMTPTVRLSLNYCITFDTERDLYVCPGGKELRKYRRAFSMPREGIAKDGAIRYRAAQHDCHACALKLQCSPNVPARKIARSVHEAA